MEFKKYNDEHYLDLCRFFKALNFDKRHINWNWARLEWMIGHPYLDLFNKDKMGLWYDKDKIVGAAIYDLGLGEAFVNVLPGYENLYQEVLDYAYNNLQDDNGLGISVNDDNKEEIEFLTKNGFKKVEQRETILKKDIDKHYPVIVKEGLRIKNVNPYLKVDEMQWLFWQGFDHGDNKDECFAEENDNLFVRPNFEPYLSICIENKKKEMVAYCSFWYDKETDYAYLEPLCVIPSYRRQGLAKALVYELMNRVKELGSKEVYVISDQEFYKRIGFKECQTYSFYWKKKIVEVNSHPYIILRLLGKGKGGYSYLAERDGQYVTLKQIHHEPCSYYKFGNKIEAEMRDYERIKNAGIRIPHLIEIDINNERIVKEYIEGRTIFEMVDNDESVDRYLPQVYEMASKAKEAGINIDYFPTNFIVRDDVLYYIDYECNNYMEEWNFENWGIKYWSKTKEFLEYIKNKK